VRTPANPGSPSERSEQAHERPLGKALTAQRGPTSRTGGPSHRPLGTRGKDIFDELKGRTRANGHTAKINCVSVWASSIVLSNCCTAGSSCRMLSLRHSIGNTSPVESLARNSTSVPHFRCYARPLPTETCARCQSKLGKYTSGTLPLCVIQE
jgi:hypothetical protein